MRKAVCKPSFATKAKRKTKNCIRMSLCYSEKSPKFDMRRSVLQRYMMMLQYEVVKIT